MTVKYKEKKIDRSFTKHIKSVAVDGKDNTYHLRLPNYFLIYIKEKNVNIKREYYASLLFQFCNVIKGKM